MINLRNLAVQRKIILITMSICAVALLIAGAELFFYDRDQSRQELESALRTSAGITADNVSAAVSFSDAKATSDTLSALQSDPSIVSACVYSTSGLLGGYLRGSAACPATPGDDELRYDPSAVHIIQPILLNRGKRVGTLRLTMSFDRLTLRSRHDLTNIGLITLVASLFSLALSSLLQSWVSGPLLALTRTAKAVSETHNYSIRARKYADDELGTLVDSVNEMLSQIAQSAKDREEQFVREHYLRKEAEEANQLKDEFLATLSHELRTPLSAIVGWATLLRKRESVDHELARGMEVIHRNAHVQVKLIEDLLDVSRIATGKYPIERSDVSLRGIVEDCLEAVRPLAVARGVRISANDPGFDVRLFADAARLQQALRNILSNAVKFTPPGGSITVEVLAGPEDVRISVADTGIGIPSDFLPFVFERFRQADGSSTRKFGGLGIGLAIARHVVMSHGGTLTADSKGENQGATFQIVLPRAQTTQAGEISQVG